MKVKVKFFVVTCPFCGESEIWQEDDCGYRFLVPDSELTSKCTHDCTLGDTEAEYHDPKTGETKDVPIETKEVEIVLN